MPKLFKTGLLASTALTLLFASGCAFGGEQALNQMKEKEANPPQEVTYVEDSEALEGEKEKQQTKETNSSEQEEAVELRAREVYLFDKNGYVVPQTLKLPKTKAVAKQSLEYLVKNGPVTELLPNGFQAVLPQGTQVLGLNLEKNGTIVADFSKEFANYKPENEQKILQAITWTLTQFEGVEKVKIRINGYDQPFMPVNGTPINEGYSRANGINFDNGEVVDMTDSKAVTLYFLSQNGKDTYYVPVTRRVDNDKAENEIAMVVNELVKGPGMKSDLLSEFHPNIKLLSEPKYEDGTVTLNFNKAVLGSLQGTAVSENLIQPLVLTLTEQTGVENVAIKVNGGEKIYSESGAELSKPVSRPEKVNTGSF